MSTKSENNETKKRVAIYVRVSTQDQVEHGYSLDRQISILKDECIKRGWKYRYIYREEGISGKNFDRPKFLRMIQMAEQRRFDIVLVWKLDRLGRSNIDLQYMREYLKLIDIELVSYTEPFDATTVAGKFMFDMLAGVAEWERSMIVERTKMGIIGRASQGKWKGGLPPFGYDYNRETEKLEINEAEAAMLRHIYEKYLEIGTIDGVRRYLKSKGILTRQGKKWSPQTISRVLSNPIYVGKYVVCGVTKDMEELRIIPEDLSQKVRELKKRNRAIYSVADTPKLKKNYEEVPQKCSNCGYQLYGVGAYCSNCGIPQWLGVESES